MARPVPPAAKLTPDHCSFFAEGNWGESCCLAHDLAYAKGGTPADRKAADKALCECVAACGHPLIAKLMYAGVRVGGASRFWPWINWGHAKRENGGR